MRKIGMVILGALLGACSTAQPTTAPQEVRTQVETTMAAFAALNWSGFMSGLNDDVTAFETDFDGKPLVLGSRDAISRWAEGVFAQVKDMGASLALDIHSVSCHSNPTLAFCTVQFDLRALMPDGTAMVQPTINTVVLRRDDTGWKWIHWHSSPGISSPATS